MGDNVTRLDRVREHLDHPAAATESPPLEAYAEDPETAIGISDDELALRFTERHANELRYVPAWDQWLMWDGMRWGHDEKRRVFNLARALCRDVLTEKLSAEKFTDTQVKALRNRLGAATTVYALIKLAGSDPRHAVSVTQLDADPWALNTPAGILDLRTGEMRPHDPAALHTKITAAAPGGDCPLFEATLARAQPDPAVREYIRRLAGYGLTGSAREHILAFWHGDGGNGKGTIAHALRRALGDYAIEVQCEMFMESNHDRHPTELAQLRSARLVVASEIDRGRRWNEARLKRLTGGDPISARFIGKDFFEFAPEFTLVIVGNNKPGLQCVDEAIRRRMHLLEFATKVPPAEQDQTLPEKLVAEYGGILAWALAGCLDWLDTGLIPPEAVRRATAAYLAGEDMLQAWIDECCNRGGQIKLSVAHQSYRSWCERNGAAVLGRNSFGDQLEARGYRRQQDAHTKGVVFVGLMLPLKNDPRVPD